MTDVPRRSYPMVVPPPGGFEHAVQRGRRIRRRRAGSSTGAALALVGALAYSTMNGPGSPSGLQVTNDVPGVQHTQQPAPGSSVSPEPSVSPTAARPSDRPQTVVSGPAVVPGRGAAPSGGVVNPPPTRGTRPTNDPAQPPRYAARPPINRTGPEVSSMACVPASGTIWCANANTVPIQDSSDRELVYTLCRAVDAGAGRLHFDRKQQADFAVTDVYNADTVWTYSAGQPVEPQSETIDVPAGQCLQWRTVWDGYDDFGFTPPPGAYRLHARSMGTADTPLPTGTSDFEHGTG